MKDKETSSAPELDADDNDGDNQEIANPKQAAAQAEVLLASARQQREQETKSSRNKLLIILVILALIVGTAVFLFTNGGSSSTEQTSTDDLSIELDNTANEVETVAPRDFGDIIYLHSSGANTPYRLYSRPAKGGDRVDLDFSINGSMRGSLRYGNTYVFQIDNELYSGTGNEKPNKIFEAPSGDITSYALDVNASEVLVSTVVDYETGNLYIAPLDGSNLSGELFDSEGAVPDGFRFAEFWDSENQEAVVRISCWGCDGYNGDLYTVNNQGVAEKVYTAQGGACTASRYVYSTAGDALYTLESEISRSAAQSIGLSQGLCGTEGPPYELIQVKHGASTDTVVATFGDLEDELFNGFFPVPVAFWADFADGERPAYAYQKKLYVQTQNGQSYSNYFETSQEYISSIYAVDEDEVLVGGKNNEGETISYYNIDTAKGSIVMETLPTTRILTVTKN